MNILVTGGAGYIGSHTLIALCQAGYVPVVIDSFVNSKPESVSRVEKITERAIAVEAIDVRDVKTVTAIMKRHKISAVIHFAALKAVGESVAQPLAYYDNNVVGTIRLLQAMQAAGVKTIIFSSSATVYGTPEVVPILETAPLQPESPYGYTKVMAERMIQDAALAAGDMRVALLRYFNPVGAHASGLIGEDPRGIPNNLMPYITQVAAGALAKLRIYGSDYPTPDGTGVRDYIHVMDLAEGHVAALRRLDCASSAEQITINLGTSKGSSVLDVVRTFEKINGVKIPHEFVPRRPGDVATCYADAALAERELGWKATRSLEDMCRDAWNWQSKNPNGYAD